jgi:hypothetical protein
MQIHKSRAWMIVARSQSFQADFSSVAFHDDELWLWVSTKATLLYGVRRIMVMSKYHSQGDGRKTKWKMVDGDGGLGGGGRRPKIKMGLLPRRGLGGLSFGWMMGADGLPAGAHFSVATLGCGYQDWINLL